MKNTPKTPIQSNPASEKSEKRKIKRRNQNTEYIGALFG